MRVIEFFIAFFLTIAVLIAGLVFVFFQRDVFEIKTQDLEAELTEKSLNPGPLPEMPEAVPDSNSEIGIVKSIYLTSWSASKKAMIDYLIDIARTTEINAVVIDVKDFSGYVGYNTGVREVEKYGAEQIRIVNIDSLVKELHKEGIYTIARITVFQDPILAWARPDLAIYSKARLASPDSSILWLDDVGLAWIDPAAKEAWDYNIAIAKDALSQGFDEINFDYVRFPSDGDLQDMVFPFWDGQVPKHTVIREFFKELRQQIPRAKISIDLFGLSTINFDDLGVGQIIEDGFGYFDYVCPMIYPSHYADGFIGYQNPAEYPYEVVRYSMEGALKRLRAYKELEKTEVQLRPWLQDFDLGATYDAEMLRAEINAVYDSAKDDFSGFMLWNSWNYYTRGALELE